MPSNIVAAADAPIEAKRSDRFPRQIKFIVGNEACERFSYYGMLGILGADLQLGQRL